MDRVLARLKLVTQQPSGTHETLLRRAIEAWMVNDPKEFKNRDTISKGLCTQLARDVGASVRMDGSNREVISAHLLTLSRRGLGRVRAVAKSKWLKCSIEDHMHKINEDDRANSTCVILIDMQVPTGPTAPAALCYETRYNSYTVIENQASVLEAGVAYGMHVFEIRIVRKFAMTDTHVSGERSFNDPTLPALVEAMRPCAPEKKVEIDKPYFNSFQGTGLEDELRKRGIRLAIVMGYEANTCVRNTIFGTTEEPAYGPEGKYTMPYQPGLLDRGISVLTSRVVLAGTPLVPEYGMTG